jgi:SAM-dependent methyltransferase
MMCCCCGCRHLKLHQVLWDDLIAAWRLASHEVAYIDRQQGLRCDRCGCNLRGMALAKAIMGCFGFAGLFQKFVRENAAQGLRILEVNEAGNLTQFLDDIPGHVLRSYPDIDMMSLPYGEAAFDLVVHSDTLEHVPHPVRGLSECARVLRVGGYCAFTVPIVVDRLTISRAGLPASYHGSADNPADCLVHTEYGADAWRHVVQAGFPECRLFSLEYPAAQALVGVKHPVPDEKDPQPRSEAEELTLAAAELADLLPQGAPFILVDEDKLPKGWIGGYPAVPFLERDGVYWGKPADDETAIRELERLRRSGLEFLVFAWPAFWWLLSYDGLRRHLHSQFRCLLDNERLVVFDLRPGA